MPLDPLLAPPPGLEAPPSSLPSPALSRFSCQSFPDIQILLAAAGHSQLQSFVSHSFLPSFPSFPSFPPFFLPSLLTSFFPPLPFLFLSFSFFLISFLPLFLSCGVSFVSPSLLSISLPSLLFLYKFFLPSCFVSFLLSTHPSFLPTLLGLPHPSST